jgi:hypothetical protein
MTNDDLSAALAQYKAGLEAEVALLQQLDAVAARQRHMTETRDLDRLAVESDERDSLMRGLITVEETLRPVRACLQTHKQKASALPGYAQVAELRETATTLVQRILASDQDSMKSLADAELARRAALASLEKGETTLAAYRKVLAPTDGATLLDLRG